jgi:hypothetical protein
MSYYSPYNQPGAGSNIRISEYMGQDIRFVGLNKYVDAEVVIKFVDVFSNVHIADKIFPTFKDRSSLFEDKLYFSDFISQLNVITGVSVYLDEETESKWCFDDYLITQLQFSSDFFPEYHLIDTVRFTEFLKTDINIQGGKQNDSSRPTATMQTAM